MLKKDIEKVLVDKGCPTNMLANMVEKVANLQPQLAKDFETWVNNPRVVPSMEIEGINFNALVQQYKMQPIGAFLSLDWLLREPQKAAEAIKRGRK